MEELLKKQQNIRFSGAGASYQNGAAERAIKTIVTMERTMLMHAALRFPDENFSTDIWTMAMDYDIWDTIGSLIYSVDYPLLKYGQGQGLNQCQKNLATLIFGVVQHMF